jgi:hypothetical protein
VLLLILAAFTLLPAPFLWIAPPGPLRSFAAGALTVSGVWMMWWITVQLTGTASIMAGALGEQWTASALRKLKRSGWRVLNHVVLRQYGDIDHVAVGAGGVLVVESKWTSEAWPTDSPYLSKAVERVQRDVASLHGMIQARVGRGKVKGLVVIWGAGIDASTDALHRDIDGIALADSETVHDVLAELAGHQALTKDEVEDVWRILDQHVTRRERADAVTAEPPIPSASELAGTIATGAIGATAGLIGPALAYRLPGATVPSVIAALAIAVVGWRARPIRVLRWLPAGLVLGAEFWLVLIAASFVFAFSRLL